MVARPRYRYLLDTNILSEPMRRKPDPGLLRRLDRHEAEVTTAATVWHELVFGLERMPPSRRRDSLQKYVEGLRTSLPVLPFDDAAAEWQGRERARLERQGRPLPFQDLQIAAVARVHDLVLVTVNVADFEPVSGLQIENWRRPTAAT